MTPRDYIQKMADERFTGEMRNAFLDSISRIADAVVLQEIASRIQMRDVQGAVVRLHLRDDAFDPVKVATVSGFGAAGRKTTNLIPPASRGGQKIKVAFDPGSRSARQAVDNLHTNLIREVTEETRGAVAQEIRDGLERGKNPRDIARAIRGSYNQQAKRFDNSVIGLTRQQQRWVSRAEAQLASGDPAELRQYLGRKLRDRRYDSMVLKAINEERVLTQAEIDKMTEAYRRRTIAYRAEVIGRDQALEALTIGQEEAMDQAVDQGAVRNQDFIKEWVTSRDSRVRDAHSAVPAMNRGGIRRDEMFDTPLGPLKRPRHRGSPGSVPANVIMCRCSQFVKVRRQK